VEPKREMGSFNNMSEGRASWIQEELKGAGRRRKEKKKEKKKRKKD